jgi:L-ascorbate 6-phosphate lactonase
MSRLAYAIRNTHVEVDRLAIFWLGQAGFVYKTPGGQVIYIDPYLTDYVERRVGYKRIMATPIQPEEVEADLLVSTHAHADH